jgi:hypothetical protein
MYVRFSNFLVAFFESLTVLHGICLIPSRSYISIDTLTFPFINVSLLHLVMSMWTERPTMVSLSLTDISIIENQTPQDQAAHLSDKGPYLPPHRIRSRDYQRSLWSRPIRTSRGRIVEERSR